MHFNALCILSRDHVELGLAQRTEIRDASPRHDALKVKLVGTVGQVPLRSGIHSVLTDTALEKAPQTETIHW